MAILTQTNLRKIGVEVTLNKLPGGLFRPGMGQAAHHVFLRGPAQRAGGHALWAFANSAARI